MTQQPDIQEVLCRVLGREIQEIAPVDAAQILQGLRAL